MSVCARSVPSRCDLMRCDIMWHLSSQGRTGVTRWDMACLSLSSAYPSAAVTVEALEPTLTHNLYLTQPCYIDNT